jgi:PAS domain S-box-containing protein
MERKKAFFNLLQFKIHLGIQFILAVCFFGLGYFIHVTQLDFLINDIRRQGLEQAEMVAQASVTSIQRESFYLLEDLATKAEYSPLVAYCQILDPIGKSLLRGEVRVGLTRDDLMTAYSEHDVTVVTRDIVSGGQRIGQVKMGMFIDKARQEVLKTSLRLAAAFVSVLGGIALFLYVYLNRLLILPVINLSVLTKNLSRGEFVTTSLDQRKDEIGVLADGFNTMSRSLKEVYRSLEDKVDARTEDLNNAYHELQAIFDNSLVGIAVLAQNQKVIRANRRFGTVFGYSPEEMPLVGPEKFHVSGRNFEEFMDKHFSRLAETEIAQLEYQFRKKNGAVFWSQVSAKAIDPNDMSRGVIFVLEDISDRKKASELLRQHAEDLRLAKEEADNATRSKSEFLARMSHEIRTPMNAILGMAEMLQETRLDEDQREYVKTFSSAGELLLGIINDILDFSKIEVGQIKLESIPFNLRELVVDVNKLFVYRAEEKSLALEKSVSPGLAQRYIGDPTRIRQIIINLLGNAIKFTSTGGVTLSVTDSVMNDGAPCCLFAVKDTGIGIPKSKQNAIFESFAQADSSTTREFGGTGLGLAISKKLVELMGGKIWVESDPGQGTTFFFKLPLAPDFQVRQTEFKLKIPADTRVLVVEDQPDSHDSMSFLVRGWGIKPVSCMSVAQAVDTLTAHKGEGGFQAILIDSAVDGEPGMEVVQLLIGQGIPMSSLILVVDSPEYLSKLPDASDFGPLWYVLKSDLGTVLHGKIYEVVSEFQRRRMTDLQDKSWKILLVDDVEANRRVVELFLKSANVNLVHAENGKIAVEKFIEEPFDLVLMDMEMPVMDGLEATRRIRMWEREKRDFKTPIIALTAHAFQEHRQKTVDAGCTEFLAKPIKKQALIDVIDLFAGQRESLVVKPAAAPVASPVKPILDGVDSPVQIDPELEDLRPLFLRTVRDFQSQIADAITGSDFVTMQRCGHSLKGLGSTYAVEEISQAGKIIESAAKSRQVEVVIEAANHLAVFMNTGESPKIQPQDEPEEMADTDILPEPSSGRFMVHVAPEMSELIPFLMDAMQKDLELMNKALAQKDFPTVRRFGHSHKGFGSTYGFDYISAIGRRIQTAADARDPEQLSDLLMALGNYLERVEIVYDVKSDLVEEAAAVEEPVAAEPAGEAVEEVEQDYTVEVDEELYELVPLFMDTMRSNIAEMKDALPEQNYDIICRHGHSQKGLGSTYGFDFLGLLGQRIETAGRQRNVEEIKALLDEMSAYLENVQIVDRKG